MTLDGETVSEVPIKQKYKSIEVVCDNGATGEWDTEKWGVLVTNINNVKTKCAINFETLNTVNVTVHGAVQETIRLSDGQTIVTDATGIGTAEVKIGETYTLTGSVSEYTSEEQVVEDTTTDLYAMPKGSLYWYGNLCSDVTGGFVKGYYQSGASYTFRANDILLISPSGDTISVCTKTKVNTTGYSKLKSIISASTSSSDMVYRTMYIGNNGQEDVSGWGGVTKVSVSNPEFNAVKAIDVLDISSYQGEYYVHRGISGYFTVSSTANIHAIWLE